MKISSLDIQEVAPGSLSHDNDPTQGFPRSKPLREGVRLDRVVLKNFRNYDDFLLDGIGNLTLLVGPNAVGKTTIVEAVQMVTDLKSFRTTRYGQTVRWGSDIASVDAHLIGDGRDLNVRLVVKESKRSYSLNGKSKQIQDLKGILPAVTFCPDDLNLAKGSNTARRDAIDGLGSQISKNFYAVRNDYLKLLKQKNRALKDELSDAYLDSIDEVLVRVGTQLIAHRMVILDKMNSPFIRFHDDITAGKENLSFAYIPSWEEIDIDSALSIDRGLEGIAIDGSIFNKGNAMDRYFAALRANRSRERAYGRSVIGPHADKISFLLDGRNEIHYSSQGQQRSIVLAFKLAEAAVIDQTLNQKPILLLDDVMSELDADRRQYFMNFISDDIQTIITTTNKDYFNEGILSKADVVELHRKGGG